MITIEQPVQSALTRARKALAARQYSAAAELFEQVLTRKPASAQVMLELAQVYHLMHRRQQALALLSQAISSTVVRPEILGVAGQLYGHMRMHEKAGQAYRRVLTCNPKSVAALLSLGELAERMHQLVEARDFTDRVLKISPQNPRARLLQAVLDERENDWQRADRRLSDLVSRRDLPNPISWKARYQHARVLDRMGEYDGAMEQLLAAKAILQADATRFRKRAEALDYQLRQSAEGLIPAYSRDWQHSRTAESSPRLAVLVGHPRSGTTLLEQVIDGHSDVATAEELPLLSQLVHDPIVAQSGEQASIIEALDRLTPDQLTEYRRDYFEGADAWMSSPLKGRLLLDKSPEAIRLVPTIARVFSWAKLIVAIRDPRDVCLSCFMQPLPLNGVSVCFLELQSTIKRYASVMQAWLRFRRVVELPWRETRYEDVIQNLESEVRAVGAFLDLPHESQMLQTQQTARSRYVHSPSYASVAGGVYRESVGRWKNYGKYLAPYLEQLDPFLDEWSYTT
ncbi:tetratricopeptide repeat-containing sulfotransferase family protein [Aeoliella sp.]|uniref:tetratricopeptide repeat-containing sulfotransferase family protein n=1 Tax=Aeoliella sp. TaxID=2795800 RepID=UPI003CCBEC05